MYAHYREQMYNHLKLAATYQSNIKQSKLGCISKPVCVGSVIWLLLLFSVLCVHKRSLNSQNTVQRRSQLKNTLFNSNSYKERGCISLGRSRYLQGTKTCVWKWEKKLHFSSFNILFPFGALSYSPALNFSHGTTLFPSKVSQPCLYSSTVLLHQTV